MTEQGWLALYDHPDAPAHFVHGTFEQLYDARRRDLRGMGIVDVDLPPRVLRGLFGHFGSYMARVNRQYADAVAPQVAGQRERQPVEGGFRGAVGDTRHVAFLEIARG